jgi:uncharacterized protein
MSQEQPPTEDWEYEPPPELPPPPPPGVLLALACSFLFILVLLGTTFAGALAQLVFVGSTSGNLPQFLEQEAQSLAQGQPSPELKRAMTFGMVPGHLSTLALALAAARFFHGPRWPILFGLHRLRLIHLFLALLLLPGLMIVHGGIHEFLNWLANIAPEEANNDIIEMFHSWPRVFMIAIVGIGPGVIEELWCRGVLGRGLVVRHGVVLGVLVTSVLFGAMHLSPLYAIGTAMMGVGLHATFLLTRSLWIPIVLHILNNTITGLATVGDLPLALFQQGSSKPSIFVYFAAVFLTVAGFWALVACREKECENATAKSSPSRSIAPTLLALIAFVFLGYAVLKHE